MLCHIYIGRCYALADVIAMYVVVDGKPQRQMLLPLLYQDKKLTCGYSIWHHGNNIYQLSVTHPKVVIPSATWQ